MDPPNGCRPWRPCLLHHLHHHHHLLHHHHHHHHHHHPLFLCPHHHHNHHTLLNPHHHLHPTFASFPQHAQHTAAAAAAAIPLPTHLNSETSGYKEAHNYNPTPQEEEKPGEVGDGGLEEEEDGDPVFQLTDEWKEFFAKSEAKRKLAKQQAKKKGKRQIE